MRLVILLAVALLSTGCRSIDSLPKDAALVDFDRDGRGLWRYEGSQFFPGASVAAISRAAKTALVAEGFKDIRESESHVAGKHGATPWDWNVVAAAYWREEDGGTRVHVIANVSRDFGFLGFSTAKPWPKSILQRIAAETTEPKP